MLSQHLLSESHPELFHYTGVDGLEGILRSQCLWATHWQYLNDAKELDHFAVVLPQLIKPGRIRLLNERASQDEHVRSWVNANGGADLLCEKESQGLALALRHSVVNPDPAEQIFEFFVTSLCTAEGAQVGVRTHGLLSQWRYYGKQGGYAIVLDSCELERLMRLEHDRWKCRLSLGDVAYSDDPPDVLGSRLSDLPVLLRSIDECQFDSSKSCEPLLNPVLQCFIHYKHWCFAEEREVRLVAVLNGPRMRELHQTEGTEWPERQRHYCDGVPRIHLFEGLEVTGRRYRLPIVRILVGPGPSQRERETKLRALLDELQFDIPVTLSDMPIRF